MKSNANEAFSLVEVTVAIGIFAFVIVGIIGLFPTALKMRGESSVETRSAMIVRQLFAGVNLSIAKWTNPSGNVFTNITLRDGPGLTADNSQPVNLLNPNAPIVLGYPSKSSVPYYLYKQNGKAAWDSGIGSSAGATEPPYGSKINPPASSNDIVTLAKISATNNVPGSPKLYQVSVEVRSPAFAPLTNTKPSVFTTLFYAP
jgi:type II secretory pathway pseudopilin PulG